MIKIINLLPELLGTYGDRGNVATLSWRLNQRGIANEVIQASARETIPTNGDFYLLGGGEDDAQVLTVDLEDDTQGAVMEELGRRRGEVQTLS